MEEYHDKVLELGVKKVTYLKDVTEGHLLNKIGMKELEVKRILTKIAQSAPQDSDICGMVHPRIGSKEKVTSFGLTCVQVPFADFLVKEHALISADWG